MAAPHTPDLDKPKLHTPPSMSPLSAKAVPGQGQNLQHSQGLAVLPLTPKATPVVDTLTYASEDEYSAVNEPAVKTSIETLTAGRNQTADFVPDWHSTEDASLTDASQVPTGSLSSSGMKSSPKKLRAAFTLTQMALGLQPRTVTDRASPESLNTRKRRASASEPTARPYQATTPSADGLTASQQTNTTSAEPYKSKRKDWVGLHFSARASALANRESYRRTGSSSHEDAPKTISTHAGAPQPFSLANGVSTGHWLPITEEGPSGYGRMQPKEWAKHLHQLGEAGARSLPIRRSSAEEPEQAESTRKSRPAPRPNAAKASKYLTPHHDGQQKDYLRKSRAGLPGALTGQISFADDKTLSDNDSESEDEGGKENASLYSARSLPDKTKTTSRKPSRILQEHDDSFKGSVPGRRKTTVVKRKGFADEQERPSNGPIPKKRKVGTRGTGEGKVKSKKDKKLGEIKHWLDSKTQKWNASKRPGEDRTPDHKSDYKALSFVRLPDVGTRIDTVTPVVDEKLAPKGEFHPGDPKHLHSKEQELARMLNLTYDQYRCQKRRIFAARAVFDQIHEREALAPSWGRTQTQLVGSIDANKSSYLYTAFDEWGWFGTMKEKWDDDYPKTILEDFTAHDQKQPWSPPSNN